MQPLGTSAFYLVAFDFLILFMIMGGDALFPPLGALVSQGPIRSTAAPVYGLGGVCWMHVCAHYVRYVRDMEMRAPASYAELWWKYDDIF